MRAAILQLAALLTACSPNENRDRQSDTSSGTPVASYASIDKVYNTCAEAIADGAAPLNEGDEGYSEDLDRDGDGVACENFSHDADFEKVGDTSLCHGDCSGHDAGFDWARDHNITDESECGGNSQSFIEGCEAYVADL